jgi:hypothetical protein
MERNPFNQNRHHNSIRQRLPVSDLSGLADASGQVLCGQVCVLIIDADQASMDLIAPQRKIPDIFHIRNTVDIEAVQRSEH